ncbi:MULTISPECIES: hypothetical protein [Agrobacterium tumefaciens complex]|uniref:hypothetical protein n=1 Tax=Agrobacterium tumefaciens complex TaxID=1183400 RepID=UPI0013CEC3EE|nr:MULTISPECIES: hypothetical protein [Agrobacterium tumefaciens complex]NSZ10727.1 hypothetical protein [Agrobacterium fabrum]
MKSLHDFVLHRQFLETLQERVKEKQNWLPVECRCAKQRELLIEGHKFHCLDAARVPNNHFVVIGDMERLEAAENSVEIVIQQVQLRVQRSIEQVLGSDQLIPSQLKSDYVAERFDTSDFRAIVVGKLANLHESVQHGFGRPPGTRFSLEAQNVEVCIRSRNTKFIGPDLKVEQLFVSDLLSLLDNSRLYNRKRRSADSKNAGKKRLEIVNYVAPTAAGRLIKNRAGLRKEYRTEQRRNYDKNDQYPQSSLLIFRHFAPPRSSAHMCSLHFSVRSKSACGEVAA